MEKNESTGKVETETSVFLPGRAVTCSGVDDLTRETQTKCPEKTRDADKHLDVNTRSLPIVTTVGLVLSWIAYGVCLSILGPSLVSMEILLDTDTTQLSFALTGLSLGYFLGCVMTGLMYKRINHELMFAVTLACLGIVTIVAPFCVHVYTFAVMISTQGIFMGIIDAGSPAYILNLWQGHKYQKSMLIGIYFAYSLGSTLGPFMMEPFLPDITNVTVANKLHVNVAQSSKRIISYINGTGFSNENDTKYNISNLLYTEFGSSMNSNAERDDFISGVQQVRYGYVISGALAILPCIIFSVSFVLKGFHFKPVNISVISQTPEHSGRNTSGFKVTLICLVWIGFFTFMLTQYMTFSYTATFAVKGLGWQNNMGALLTATHCSASTIAKLSAIPVVHCISPAKSTIFSQLLMLSGCIMLLFAREHNIMAWLGSALSGVGLANLLAWYFSWLSGYMLISGALSSILMTGMSLGAIVGPFLVGSLFTTYGPMVFVYILFGGSIIQLLAFVSVLIFVNVCDRRKQDQCEVVQELTIT